MGTKVINFYNEFTCLASECPNTCCRGWRISIDPKTAESYRQEKGAEGLRLKATMSFGKDKEIRRFFGRCANETKDGLCRLQKKGREDLMPEVCRIYPRRGVKIGDDEEVTFELSCPLTAKLFLENVSDIRLIDYEGDDIIPVWTQDLFDEKYYHDILKIRDKVTRYIRSDKPFPEIMNNLFRYFRKVHRALLARDGDIKAIPIEDIDEDPTKVRYNFYSFEMFDKIIMNDLNDGRFKIEDPLREFIYDYNKIFADMTAMQADIYFQEKAVAMLEEYPSLDEKYRGYFIYILLQSLYSSYESVTFYKEFLLSLVYLTALITTDVVDYVNDKDMLNVDRQIKHLNGCERRFRHNVGVKKSISHRIDEEFTKKKEGFIF
ncbi:MAG: flagellin lysine-N-methylase [Lachnospiraceae bacterium]|nr:flagellin lysine-N-methylase [Lachnospiraceae bacterium]